MLTCEGLSEKMGRDVDDLTPLDARESLLMENPPRKEYAEMSHFNFTGPYEPYRDQYPKSGHDRTGSTDRLVGPDYAMETRHGRNMSRDSRQSRESSPDGRTATKPGYGFAY